MTEPNVPIPCEAALRRALSARRGSAGSSPLAIAERASSAFLRASASPSPLPIPMRRRTPSRERSKTTKPSRLAQGERVDRLLRRQ